MSFNDTKLSSHILSSYYAPRGRIRIFDLGIQLAQQYLSPFDKLIGFIGEAGSGKSALIKGMFPGLELTNDDDGVNVRPLPLLEQSDEGFFSPHTYHVDIRFEMGFTQLPVLAEAIEHAIDRGKRVIVEHFDLIYPVLKLNADLIIGVGEEILITRPNLFGPEPKDIYDRVYSSLPYRLMAHTAEDLCEYCMPNKYTAIVKHDDVKHGFIMVFDEVQPDIDLVELEKQVKELIDADVEISYLDDSHISIGGVPHSCMGPRTHVSHTGAIENFNLLDHFIYDKFNNRYLMVGGVGEKSKERLERLEHIKGTA
jgi:hypothetical protein